MSEQQVAKPAPLNANDFAKQFQKSLLNRFITTAPSAKTQDVVTQVFRGELNAYLRKFGLERIKQQHVVVRETETKDVFKALRTPDELSDEAIQADAAVREDSRFHAKVLCKASTQRSTVFSDDPTQKHDCWLLQIATEKLNYTLSIRILRDENYADLSTFFTDLSDHTEFYKSLWAFASQRKLPHLISEYHKTLDWHGVFSSYWTEPFLTQQVTRVRIIALFSIDLSALSDAVNPLLLAIWQQWRLSRTPAFKSQLWDAVKDISQSIMNSDSEIEANTSFGLKYDNVGLLSALLSLFSQLESQRSTVKQHKLLSVSPSEKCPLLEKVAESGHDKFIQLLASCMLVNYRVITKSDACDSEYRLIVLQLMRDVCGAYLHKQSVIDSEANNMRRLSRANLYVWLIYSVLSHCPHGEENTNDEQSARLKRIAEDTRLFEDLCYLTETTGRYMLFRSGDYPFEGKPIRLAKVLLRTIDFHANYVLETKLPSSLMQLLVDSFEAEHKFSALKDASQHVQHLTDLYMLGQYLASDDFKVNEQQETAQDDRKKDAKTEENRKIKQAYAVASLFHDIGMLEGMKHQDVCWPENMDKSAYIEQFKNIKFIDSTEAEDIQAYEYFPYQEHAFTSAALVHQEVKRFNKHTTQPETMRLEMEHPIRPAVRSILFHSMCYLPVAKPKNTELGNALETRKADIGSVTAMLLAMTDAIFTWRPSTTSIGNSQNIMCRGFGPAIQADLARFDDKQLEIIGNSIFYIRDSAVGDSIQYVLKLIQSFGRLSFEDKAWRPIILLEVADRELLLQELRALSECLYHEVCDGIQQWLAVQEQYKSGAFQNDEQGSDSSSVFTTISNAKSSVGELNEADVRSSTIYIASKDKILGNYDVIKFLQLPQVKDFIRHRSKFH